MTRRDWERCNDPKQMLEFLVGKVGDRKMRLFACELLEPLRSPGPHVRGCWAVALLGDRESSQ